MAGIGRGPILEVNLELPEEGMGKGWRFICGIGCL